MTKMALFDSLGVAAGTDASTSLLGRDVACAVFCAVAAKFWVSFWSDLAAADRIDSKLSRKLIHTGSAPLFMLCWPLFSDAPTARILASAVPLIQIIRLFRAGQVTAQDAADGQPENEAALVKAISRTGERTEALGGPFIYTVVLFTATVLGWRTPAAAVAVCQMAVGDGIADIFGRRFGTIKWPFNKR
jgi:phytol kinase